MDKILEEELIKKVTERMEKLKNTEFNLSDRYNRVKEILSKRNLYSYANFQYSDIGEVMEAFILSNTEIELDSIADDIEKATYFLNKIDYYEFGDICEEIIALLNSFYMDNPDHKEVTKRLQKALHDCGISKKYVGGCEALLNILKSVSSVNIFKTTDTISAFKGKKAIESLLNLCSVYKLVNFLYDTQEKLLNNEAIKFLFGDVTGETKRKNDVINEYISSKYEESTKVFKEIIDSMTKYCSTCEAEQKKYTRNNTKKIYHYEEFINAFKSSSDIERAKRVDYFLSRLDDEDLRVEFLKYIYQSTLEVNKSIEDEYQSLVPKDVALYHSILQKNGINIHPNDIETLNFSTPEELASSISTLKQMGVNQADMVNVLEISSLTSIKTLKSLYDRKIIDSSLVVAYPIIFNPEGASYKNILENVDLFTKYNINPLYLANHPNILLAGTSQLLPVVESLQAHEYLQQISRTTNINFIGDPNIPRTLEIIDKLDEGAVVLEDIDLLNVEQEKWKRVAILKGIGNAPTPDELRTVLTDRQFFIPDILIDDYLPITVLTKEDFTEKAKAPQRILTSPINL